MINFGYAISIKEKEEIDKFKSSAAYGTYLKAISASPAFRLIMKEHIDNVDITEDIKILKSSGKIPDTVNPKALSDLFKQSLGKMAMGLVADSVILKEIEDVKLEETLKDLGKNADVDYLLGKADKKFYEQASKLVEENKLEKNSVAYKGLMVYLKQNNLLNNPIHIKTPNKIETKINEPEKKKPVIIEKINSDDNDITL